MSRQKGKVELDYTASPGPTPRYDAKCQELKKLIGATAAKYVPELADALRQDWFRGVTDEEFRRTGTHSKRSRDLIREKILDDWSNTRRNPTPWGDDRLALFFPDWLKNPYPVGPNKENLGAMLSNLEKAKQANARRYQVKVQQQAAKAIQKAVDVLPAALKDEDEEDEDDQGGQFTYGHSRVAQYKEPDAPNPIELYEHSVNHAAKLWTDLTGIKDLIAADTVDVLVEHIIPTRKYRLRLFKGLDPAMANHLQRVLIWMDRLIQDTLRECLETNKERTNATT